MEQFFSQGFPPQEVEVLIAKGVDYHVTEALLARGRTQAWVFDYMT